MAAVKRGWLKKQSPALLKQLQKRFFVLSADAMLSYYDKEHDREPKGVIPVSHLVTLDLAETRLELDVGYRRFVLVASTASDAEAWRDAIASLAGGGSGKERATKAATTTSAQLPRASPLNTGSGPGDGGGNSRGGAEVVVAAATDGADKVNGADGRTAAGNWSGSSSASSSTLLSDPWSTATQPPSATPPPPQPVQPPQPPQSPQSPQQAAPRAIWHSSIPEVRPGVLFEGYLFKSPPQFSVRRMTEETRLQQRWFILTKRTLQWFADAKGTKPLSSVRLHMVTECVAKGAKGKHAGKFYINTEVRQFKFVAEDRETMIKWVELINAARAEAADSTGRESDRLSHLEVLPPGALSPTAGDKPDCVRSWETAQNEGANALSELAISVTQEVGEEFATCEPSDVEAIIETADRCVDRMCGVLDDALSYEHGDDKMAGAGAAGFGDASHGSGAFMWYLGRYHGSIFTHLGGLFVDEQGLAPQDALHLFCWVQGYHKQLARIQVDVSELTPSLDELASDLISASSATFARQLAAMPDEEAFECERPIAFSPSGSAGRTSSAHEATLELRVHATVLSYLRAAEESLDGPALSELIVRLLPELRSAFASVHPRLLQRAANGTGDTAENSSDRRGELSISAFNTADGLRELLARLRRTKQLEEEVRARALAQSPSSSPLPRTCHRRPSHAHPTCTRTSARDHGPHRAASFALLDVVQAARCVDHLLGDVVSLLRSLASCSLDVHGSTIKAAEALFTAEWATHNGSGAPPVRALIDAADVRGWHLVLASLRASRHRPHLRALPTPAAQMPQRFARPMLPCLNAIPCPPCHLTSNPKPAQDLTRSALSLPLWMGRRTCASWARQSDRRCFRRSSSIRERRRFASTWARCSTAPASCIRAPTRRWRPTSRRSSIGVRMPPHLATEAAGRGSARRSCRRSIGCWSSWERTWRSLGLRLATCTVRTATCR